MLYVFGDFELDAQRYELRKVGIVQPLEPQGFKVLAYLLEHCDRVVAKDELLEQLWPNQHVTEATLTQRMVAIRRALGDSGRSQRYIKTVQRRGYRFLAPVTLMPQSLTAPEPFPMPHQALASLPCTPTQLIGRETELQRIHQCFSQACQGIRQVVFITGEAGIGKTALVDTVVHELGASADVTMASGQCIEHYGGGEPYLPVLEALSRLCRHPEGGVWVESLRQYAPSWLLHLPGLLPPAEQECLQHAVEGTTRARMLREGAEVLEAMTAQQPLVLVLEDVHWSDVSTLDWLAYVARRRDAARLLVLATYRPEEAQVRGHPLAAITQELQRQGQAVELRLPALSTTSTQRLVAQRFGEQPWVETFATVLQQRTEGNPFFMSALLEALVQQEILTKQEDAWILRGEPQTISHTMPTTIRQLLEHHLAHMSPEEQELLAVASVAGVEFAAATVAAVTQRPLEEVERCYDRFAQRGQFVHADAVETYPDGTVSTRYRFLHALYHEILYERIAPGRRARWHHRIGTWKSIAYGSQAVQVAAELARHFEQGQDSSQAIVYYQQASESAIRRSAHREAVGHTRRALALLEGQPPTPARASQEIALLVMLAASLQALQGYGAPELGALYTRALALASQGGAPAQLFGALLGASSFSIFRTQYSAAQERAEQCLHIAQSLGDIPLVQAHVMVGRCALARGAFAVALEHFEQGIALYRPQYHRQARAFLLHDPGVMGLLFSAWALWRLGYPERAGQRSATARALAQELGHPFSLACALGLGTWLQQYRGDVLATQAQSMETIRLATEHGFPFWAAQGTFLHGWSLAAQGQTAQGLQQMHQGVQLYQAIIGLEGGQTAFLPAFVEVLCQTQKIAEARRLLDAGMRRIAANGEEDYRAELLRLHGEVLLACSATHQAEAEQCFLDSLAVARHQQAKMWELRTALSLGRLWLRQNRADEARTLVAEIYGWFSEGFDLAELRQAREMLAGSYRDQGAWADRGSAAQGESAALFPHTTG